MSKENKVEDHLVPDKALKFRGTVDEALPGSWFQIICEGTKLRVLATLSGRLRKNKIRILPGDYVEFEVSPYDLTRGRITWRQ